MTDRSGMITWRLINTANGTNTLARLISSLVVLTTGGNPRNYRTIFCRLCELSDSMGGQESEATNKSLMQLAIFSSQEVFVE